jgi:hypothetical protein
VIENAGPLGMRPSTSVRTPPGRYLSAFFVQSTIGGSATERRTLPWASSSASDLGIGDGPRTTWKYRPAPAPNPAGASSARVVTERPSLSSSRTLRVAGSVALVIVNSPSPHVTLGDGSEPERARHVL